MSSTYIEKAFVEAEIDIHSKKTLREIWKDEDGLRHRGRGLPAVTTYDPATGEPDGHEYWFHEMRHRTDGPAVECLCPETGVVFFETWYRFDKELGSITRDVATGLILESDFDEPEGPAPTDLPGDLTHG